MNIERKIKLDRIDIIEFSLKNTYSGRSLFLQIMSWIVLLYIIKMMITENEKDFSAIMTLVLCIIVVIFIPIQNIINILKISKNSMKDINMCISKEYIKGDANNKEIFKVDWKDITKVQDDVKYYFIYIKDKKICIPKKFYSKEELNIIKDLIYTKIDREKIEKLY